MALGTEIIKKINRDLILLFEEGINIKSSESFYEEITASVPKDYLDFNFYKNMNFSCSSNKRFYKLFHRFLDIVISLTGLLVFSCATSIHFYFKCLHEQRSFVL